MGRLSIGDCLILVLALALIGGGLAFIGTATRANVEAVQTRQDFESSGAAARATQVVAEPTPLWVSRASASSVAPPTLSAAFTTDGPSSVQPAVATLAPAPAVRPASIVAEPQWRDVAPLDAGFRFLDPPEPGARAEIWARVAANGPDPAGFLLSIPHTWFDTYRVAGSQPNAQRSADTSSERRFLFTNLGPGTTLIMIEVVSTAEGVGAPTVRIESADGSRVLGEAHPQTVAPPPNPGPISRLRIDRLGMNVAVVPTSWEPPPFIVGELKDSANVSLGNSVLVGHLTGAAGAVFSNLDDLSLGDPIVAVSRGLEYTFVVSDKQTLPNSDTSLAQTDDQPRLTLMTCTGTWDPIAHDYSDRLWVVAEPATTAAATIAANANRPPTATSTGAPGAPDGLAADPTTVVAVAGLGAARSTFDTALGPPLGETPRKLVVYRQGSSEYHVRFRSDSGRADLIAILPRDGATPLDISAAVTRSRAEFPEDAAPLIPVPESADNWVVERFTSPAVAALLGQSSRGGDAGDFIATYLRDSKGNVTRVIVATGSDRLQAQQDADN